MRVYQTDRNLNQPMGRVTECNIGEGRNSARDRTKGRSGETMARHDYLKFSSVARPKTSPDIIDYKALFKKQLSICMSKKSGFLRTDLSCFS